MSGISPRRIRSKTAELSEFFRAGNSSSRHPDNDVSTHSQATMYTLDAPSTSGQGAALTKKKSTKIPFLGISRKKSNPAGSDAEGLSVRYSTDVGESSGTGTDRRSTMEIPGSRSSTSMASTTPVKSSLGSKLAAHFQPRTRKLSALGKKPAPESTTASMSKSNTLAVADQSSVDPSLDAAARSPTPRAQPTITVSLSPENLDEYKDLFTLPRQKKSPKPISAEATPRQSNTPESSEESADSKRTTTSSIPIQSSNLPRRGSTPAAVLDTTRRRSSIARHAEQPPKPPPKPSKKPFPVEKARDSQEGSSTPRSSDGKESTGSSLSDKLTTGPSIQRRVSVTPTTPAADYSAQQRLRMRQQMQAQTPVPVPDKRNRPPDIPLPSPPASPQTPATAPPMSRTSSSSSIPKSRTRPRANTGGSINSLANSPLSQSTVPTDSDASTTPTGTSLEGQQQRKSMTPDVDLSTATPAQLLSALAARNKQCDELASLVHSLTEKHIAEKAALEKKISQLERESSKKDNQIKGLMWLVHNNKNFPATDFPANLDLPPLPPSTGPQEAPKATSRLRIGRRALHLSDDSGAESSYVTSGAESVRTSETSYSESSSVRRSKGRRPFMLGDSSYTIHRAGVSKRLSAPNSLAPDSALPDVPTNRSSIGSGSLSASSSVSSLLPPSPSVTLSSLSAIPEAPSAYRSSSDHEDRRATRAAHRLSNSSLASSSTAASSSYVANLKRSRPPSIAQVLENSPNMDSVLDKLRPFQPSS